MIRADQERLDRLYAKVFGPPAAVPEQPGTEPRFAASAAGPEDPEAEALVALGNMLQMLTVRQAQQIPVVEEETGCLLQHQQYIIPALADPVL